MLRWFLVRHGETEWNRIGRAQGQADPPLNWEGREQAEAVAARLAPVTFEAAYSSDLRRAADTALPVMRGRDTPIVYRHDLREKSFGEWEGMTYEELQLRYPAMLEELFDERPAFAPPGGESDLDLFARAAGAVERIGARPDGAGGNLLVVSHGGTLRAMMVSMLGLPLESMWRIRLSNAGLSIITTFEEGGATIDLLNDTSHLGPGFDA